METSSSPQVQYLSMDPLLKFSCVVQMETSRYPSHDFSFQSLSENLMGLTEPIYVEELHECSLETPFSFQTEEPIFPNSIQEGVFDDGFMERLLQMETDLNAVNPDTIVFEVDSLMDFDSIHQENQENVVSTSKENSHLKEIQEELMEENSIIDLLLRGAEAAEEENWPLVSTVTGRINSLLYNKENGDEPFDRLASFFTQGLQHKSINAPDQQLTEPVRKQTDTMSAFQMLHELSPYVKFAHFTANQAILEVTQGKQEVHVIDFDVMEGIQWPPLMVDLALRKEAALRITAIVGYRQNAGLIQQTGRRLKEFADSINLPFRFDQMVMEKEEDFKGIEVGQTLIANCMIFHQLHMPNRKFSSVKSFLGGVSKLSPKMIVLVEEELFNFSKTPSMSFVEFFCEALHHYTALHDSLMSSFCGEYKVGLKVIEEFLRLRIMDCVKQFPGEKNERKIWGDGFSSLKGYKAIPMSFCNVSQAKFLVGLFSLGYWVQHEKCRLALCWKSRPLTTASIWVPISNSR